MKNINIIPGVLDEDIPEADLVVGAWYVGVGRFQGDVAMWDGHYFLGYCLKFGQYLECDAVYGKTGFSPITRIDTCIRMTKWEPLP